MLNNMRIYSLKNGYKYVSLPILNNAKKENFNNYVNYNIIDKNDNNLIRAKTTIKDLVLCNDFKYFITITCKPEYNRFDLSQLRKRVNQVIRRVRLSTNKKFHFLFVPEQHKNGAWHLHGVLSGDYEEFIYSNKYLFNCCSIFDYIGFNSISVIMDIDKVGGYITKYVTKDLKRVKKGNHCYFASQGLNRPQLVDNFIYNNNYFDNEFFHYHNNDFCYVKYDKKYCKNIKSLLRA